MQLASKRAELSLALGASDLCSHHLAEPHHRGIPGTQFGLQRYYWFSGGWPRGKGEEALDMQSWPEGDGGWGFLFSTMESGRKAASWGKWVRINLICSRLKIILKRGFWEQNLPPRVLEERLAVVCDQPDKGWLLPRCPIKTLSKYHFHKVLSTWNTSQLFGSNLWSEVSRRLWGKGARWQVNCLKWSSKYHLNHSPLPRNA